MFSFYFFIFLFSSLAAYYLQRKIYSLRNYVNTVPCLDDIFMLSLFSLFLTCLASSDSSVLFYLALGLWFSAGMLLWLDAVLLHLYGFEVNISNIVIFFQGADSFSAETGAIFRTFKKRHWFLALPVFLLATVGSLVLIHLQYPSAMFAALALSACLFGSSKSKLPLKALPIWLLILIASSYLLNFLSTLQLTIAIEFTIVYLSLALLFQLPRKRLRGYFFSSSSALRHFLIGERLRPDKKITLKSEHQNLLQPSRKLPISSDQHGICADANVILITLESLSRDFVDFYTPGTAKMAYFNQLSKSGLTSEQHYACCPNTNRAIEHIYQSDYPGQGSFNNFQQLKQLGYKTAYMMISKTSYFNLQSILKRIGFDFIWDQDSEKFDPKRGDYSFIDSVDKIADNLNAGKFFLHLKSEQTHSPYHVVDKQRFARFSSDDRESRYMNAIEESDSVIAEFMAALGKRADLTNTLIIYTGDHGQSFGQFGYNSHSNSTVKQQVLTPLVISHPNIQSQTIKQSSHFDLLPTIFDLLGLTMEHACYGQNLFINNHQPLLLYSQTRKANAPSNMSLLLEDKKIMLDLIYGYRYYLDHQDNILKTLNEEEAQYYRHFFYQLLEKRGLISHSAFTPRATTRPD